ncbi:MAG: ATP-dependent RecD-like DNA helicase [Chloroflexota bacterium]
MDSLSGSVERITYYNEENGYSVVRLRPDKSKGIGESKDGLVTVTGNLPELAPGEFLKMLGQWTKHPKHGLQFNIEKIEQALPATLDGVRRYLGSGLLHGIGPKIADRIVDRFGVETLEIIENEPHRLRDVQDIGAKRAALIVSAWDEQKQIKEIMIFLHAHNISTNLAIKIYKHYGDTALSVVQENPYQLARDLFGVGFKTADKIAQSLGLPADDPTRIEAGILYVIEEMTHEGHVFAPREPLAQKVADLLRVEQNQITAGLESLAKNEMIMLESIPLGEGQESHPQNAIYLPQYLFAEIGTANRITALNNVFPSRLSDIPPALTELDKSLSPEQDQAIRTVLSHPFSILTGGPGTGKTTAIRALIAVAENAGKKYALASPTGRAAKRLSEATGKPASTIHRLLGFSPVQGFKHDEDNQLALDLLVIDEASMLDILLTNSLLKSVEPGTHIVFVGDIDQLPSVGAGDVLRDIIKGGKITITRLNVIFRQGAGSQIIENAHRINAGELPNFSDEEGDFFRFTAQDPEKAATWVEDLVTTRIPQKFNLDPLRDIQVLVPMYRGPAGITALNTRLQNVLNPSSPLKPERKLAGQVFRPGDKVMQIKNDYDKKVFNGDIGFISEISSSDNSLTVKYADRKVEYAFSEGDQLILAYAISIHKSQGSEFPAVVVPLLTQHYMMLQKNLLYTAVTRAKKLCVLVSNNKALSIAVKNEDVANRHTGLSWRLENPAN